MLTFKQLEKLVIKFRSYFKKSYFKNRVYKSMRGLCSTASEELLSYFKKYADELDVETCYGTYNGFVHCWSKINNKWIVDITSDQFYSNNKREHEVVVTAINDKRYKEEKC